VLDNTCIYRLSFPRDAPKSSSTDQKPASPNERVDDLSQKASGNGEGDVRISKEPVQLQLVHDVHLEKKASDSFDPDYFGLCSLRDGRIAVVDESNRKLLILSSSLQPLGQPYTLDYYPWDVTCYGDNRLAVTLPVRFVYLCFVHKYFIYNLFYYYNRNKTILVHANDLHSVVTMLNFNMHWQIIQTKTVETVKARYLFLKRICLLL